MRSTQVLLLLVVFLTALAAPAGTIYVDDDAPGDPGSGDPGISDPIEDGSHEHPYDAIQEGIDLAAVGDSVIVADGTYVGSGNRDLDTLGKAITVKSENGPEFCVINCQGSASEPHRGFIIHLAEGPATVLEGLQVINGYAYDGGGIYCGSSPTIRDLHVINNYASHVGGGIYFVGANQIPTIINCEIRDNTAYSSGGGMRIGSEFSPSSPIIDNCVISGNESIASGGGGISSSHYSSERVYNTTIIGNYAVGGGGISCAGPNDAGTIYDNCLIINNYAREGGGIYAGSDGSETYRNCTITGNSALEKGGGIFLRYITNPSATNCIFWNNSAPVGKEIYIMHHVGSSSLTINYSDVEGGLGSTYVESGCSLHWGGNMINEDPLFISGPAGNFYLSQLSAGSSVDSPCIDAGNDMAANICHEISGLICCMSEYTTSAENTLDSGIVDLGFHWPVDTQIPMACVNAPPSVDELNSLCLDASCSTDPEGRELTFAWWQVAGTPVSDWDESDPVHPCFVAPAVDVGGETLTFQLIVSNGDYDSSPFFINVIVTNVNHPPVADAGQDLMVDGESPVDLCADGSWDEDGDELVYCWVQVGGSPVELSPSCTDSCGSCSVCTSFDAPPSIEGGETLTFELTVCDIVDEWAEGFPVRASQSITLDFYPADSYAPVSSNEHYIFTHTSQEIGEFQGGRPGALIPETRGQYIHAAQASAWYRVLASNSSWPTLEFRYFSYNVITHEITESFQINYQHQPIDGQFGDLLEWSFSSPMPVQYQLGPNEILGYYTQFHSHCSCPEVYYEYEYHIDSSDTPTHIDVWYSGEGDPSRYYVHRLGDVYGACSTDTVDVFVEPLNHPPEPNCGLDQIVAEASTVILDGCNSVDPDGDTITFQWTQTGGPWVELSDPMSCNPSITTPIVAEGGEDLEFELMVSDGELDSFCTTTVHVQNIDDPPLCEAARATVESLWPPNHRMVEVGIENVTDPENQDVVITVESVTQDEPINGLGDGDTGPDAIFEDGVLLLRAERSGNGNGRVYEITFTAVDGLGQDCIGSVRVCVPHNKKSGCEDDGQVYSSTE